MDRGHSTKELRHAGHNHMLATSIAASSRNSRRAACLHSATVLFFTGAAAMSNFLPSDCDGTDFDEWKMVCAENQG